MNDSECDVVRDVLIIGGGPAGLAVAARLEEQTPSAIFTDDEHRRYHWLRSRSHRLPFRSSTGTIIRPKTEGSIRDNRSAGTTRRDIVVLDADAGHWMGRWKRLFKTYDITFLRSPMFFHVDPLDRDGLLAYAHESGRGETGVQVVSGCVGKEVSKHRMKKKKKGIQCQPRVVVDERDRKDYYNPSRELFWDHCREVAQRYDLAGDIVRHEHVLDIDYGVVSTIDPATPIFTVRSNKAVHYSKVVVMAVGPANQPTMPGCHPDDRHEGACHSMHIAAIPDPTVVAKIKSGKGRETNVIVVGGGLVSAQIADLAIRRGVTRVWHLMRGPVKVKPFDIDLSWLSKFRNLEQAAFWSAESDEDRLNIILKARNGGSLTGRFHKIEQAHIKTGRVVLHTYTTIVAKEWDCRTQTWTVTTDPPIQNLPPIDYIYYATGVATDFSTLPMLQTMMKKHPIMNSGGFPCLNDDLMWKDNVPLYANGRLAALRLGPGAHNLVGARAGAERVVWSIDDVLAGHDPTALHSAASSALVRLKPRARNPKIVGPSKHLLSAEERAHDDLDENGHLSAGRLTRAEARAEARDGIRMEREEWFVSHGNGKMSDGSDVGGSTSSAKSDESESSESVESADRAGDGEGNGRPKGEKDERLIRYYTGHGSRYEVLASGYGA